MKINNIGEQYICKSVDQKKNIFVILLSRSPPGIFCLSHHTQILFNSHRNIYSCLYQDEEYQYATNQRIFATFFFIDSGSLNMIHVQILIIFPFFRL